MMTKSSDRQRHQRWMLLAPLSLVSAAVVRWPFEFVAADLPVPYYTMTDAILCFWPLWSLGTCMRRAACIARPSSGVRTRRRAKGRRRALRDVWWLRVAGNAVGLLGR